MKKMAVIALLVLPLTVSGQGFDGKLLLGLSLFGDYGTLSFENEAVPADVDAQIMPGMAFSGRFPIASGLYGELGGYACGRTSNIYGVTFNMMKFATEDYYGFAGASFDIWDLGYDIESKAGFSVQAGAGMMLEFEEQDFLFLEAGVKYRKAKTDVSTIPEYDEISFDSFAPFVRVSVFTKII